MRIITSPHEWRDALQAERKEGKTIGFVPTMGALHEGHLSLMRRARQENDLLAVSIFVNPTQFNDPKDLQAYPITIDHDRRILEQIGAQYLFTPEYHEIYPNGYAYSVEEHKISKEFCGASRPGHFTGVLTVVMKLLLLTGAQRAYFGEKDWQQYRLIAGMTEAFFLETEIVPCPLVREPSGLALSSRNALLSGEERKKAPLFYQILSSGKPVDEIRNELERAGFVVDYVKRWENRILAAVFLGKVRLIDNVAISE